MQAPGRTKYTLLRLVHDSLKSCFLSSMLFWINIDNTACISRINPAIVGGIWVVKEELRRFPTLETGHQ